MNTQWPPESATELRNRIIELEAENHDLFARITASGVLSREDEAYDSGYQAARADDEQRVYRADAALAERDRMLDFVNPWRRQENKDKWLAHLRARAEEGSRDTLCDTLNRA